MTKAQEKLLQLQIEENVKMKMNTKKSIIVLH